MEMGIHNNAFQKNANTAMILGNIQKAGQTSRVRIAEELGLYRSTVTHIIGSLLEEGIVCEVGAYPGHDGGRRPILLSLNGDFGCVVGIDLQPSHFIAVVMDITGRLLLERSGEVFEPDMGKAIIGILESLRTSIVLLSRAVLAICVGIPGMVDSARNIVRYTELFDGATFDLDAQVGSRIDLPLLTENDANCCAWYHLARNKTEPRENFICIFGDYHDEKKQTLDRVGVGVGLGISLDGKVYPGSHDAAGELLTTSWRPHHIGQSNLVDAVLQDFSRNGDAYRLFVRDLFSSLVPVVSTFDPAQVYVHGNPFANDLPLRQVLQEEVPQFLDLLARRGCVLKIDCGDSAIVAKGAAMMYLQKLYSVPELQETGAKDRVVWDEVRAAAHAYRQRHGLGSFSI